MTFNQAMDLGIRAYSEGMCFLGLGRPTVEKNQSQVMDMMNNCSSNLYYQILLSQDQTLPKTCNSRQSIFSRTDQDGLSKVQSQFTLIQWSVHFITNLIFVISQGKHTLNSLIVASQLAMYVQLIKEAIWKLFSFIQKKFSNFVEQIHTTM